MVHICKEQMKKHRRPSKEVPKLAVIGLKRDRVIWCRPIFSRQASKASLDFSSTKNHFPMISKTNKKKTKIATLITRGGGRSEEGETDSSSASKCGKGSHQSEASTILVVLLLEASSLASVVVAIGVTRNPSKPILPTRALLRSNLRAPRATAQGFMSNHHLPANKLRLFQ
ncbi:hypothetical protein H5410_056417 [Solanum commersonii]|uniref:Uncharacterized protein n=1 Tax=Solanum commersonii TaxID=4109 RepID=A0A9J5WK72_SOLCO|nr:hypothetical protein H5410_056417 [Solanum commersonii]